MPFSEGVKLSKYVVSSKSDGLPASEALSIIKKVAHAVSTLHENEILHKNLSPENIIIDETGNITLIDFDFSLDFTFAGNISESKDTVEAEYRPLEQLTANAKPSEATDI